MEENDFWRLFCRKLTNYAFLESRNHVSLICSRDTFGELIWRFLKDPNYRNWTLKGDGMDWKKFQFSFEIMLFRMPTTKLDQVWGTQLWYSRALPHAAGLFSFLLFVHLRLMIKRTMMQQNTCGQVLFLEFKCVIGRGRNLENTKKFIINGRSEYWKNGCWYLP